MQESKDEDKRNHLIKSDYGLRDYHRHFSKHNPDIVLSRTMYGDIIRDFNSHIRDRMSTKGAGFLIPCRLGRIDLRKTKPEVKIDEDGSVINNLPTNWKETRKLWAENPAAKEANIKIRFTNEHTDGYTFKVSYLKGRAIFKNKSIYKMRFNRDLKRNLSKSIFGGKIDAFINKY